MISENRIRALLQPLLSHLSFYLPASHGDLLSPTQNRGYLPRSCAGGGSR
jgi:hypothetical protein